MKAEEARKLADEVNEPQIKEYLKETYSPEKAIEDIKRLAAKGFYQFDLAFDDCEGLTYGSVRILVDKFTKKLSSLGYKVERIVSLDKITEGKSIVKKEIIHLIISWE